MKFEKTNIEGLYVVELNLFNDLRGQLLKPFSAADYKNGIENKINLDIKEIWFTKSKIDVIRAMHLQVGEYACEKIVSIINGKVLDVILDTRKNSTTYGKYFGIELSENDPKALYIPKGCAHGYKTLGNNAIVMYAATKKHSPKDDVGILYNSFGFNWNIENPLISEKDKNLPPFLEF